MPTHEHGLARAVQREHGAHFEAELVEQAGVFVEGRQAGGAAHGEQLRSLGHVSRVLRLGVQRNELRTRLAHAVGVWSVGQHDHLVTALAQAARQAAELENVTGGAVCDDDDVAHGQGLTAGTPRARSIARAHTPTVKCDSKSSPTSSSTPYSSLTC